MIPHIAPPFWPAVAPGRFAGAIRTCTHELIERPESLRETASRCRVALIGLPDDTGVGLNSGRPGAREGPHAFRAALARFGVASPMDGAHYPRLLDVGDVIPGADLEATHDRVTRAVSGVLDLGLLPVAIGGGHDLTFPFVRAVAARSPGLTGVYADPHLDVRPEPGSGMAFRRLIEDCGVGPIVNLGASPLVNTAEHLDWFLGHGGLLGGEVTPAVFDRPPGPSLFVSLDLDVIDAAFAPGVSATNPDGITPRFAGDFAEAAGRAPGVACFDIMELSPPHDESGRTARLAAMLFLRFLRGVAERDAAGGRSPSTLA